MMSLRDYFAASALTSMTVAPDYSKGSCNAAMAERAYVIADLMLTEREVNSQPEHVCGLQGFGLGLDDTCDACEAEK